MQREKMIDYIAHAMKEYDDRRAKHTWRELAEVAYLAHTECLSVSSSAAEAQRVVSYTEPDDGFSWPPTKGIVHGAGPVPSEPPPPLSSGSQALWRD